MFVRVNESENQSVMHMITLAESVESVYLKEDNVNDCSLVTYTAGKFTRIQPKIKLSDIELMDH